MANKAVFSKEIFISRAGADKAIAGKIAKILRDVGYTTFLQEEDFGHTNFMARMDEGFDKVAGGGRLIALLSHAYLASEYCRNEARFPLTDDPSNKRQRLIVFRVADVDPTGHLKGIPYIDLFDLLDKPSELKRAVLQAVGPAPRDPDIPLGGPIVHPDIRPVPGFAGRKDLLKSIEKALWRKSGKAALTNSDAHTAVVKGLGGVGKSVLAQEYAWRARRRYHGVWWVRAETEQTLIDDLIDLGSRLIPNLKEVQERDRALHLALDAIACNAPADKPWLIVYDNVEKPGAIVKLTPKTSAHILITSRWSRWQGHAQELPVDVFPDDVAVDFLLAERPHETRETAGRLAAVLGHLPLALSHARAYCAETNLSFDDYVRRLSELIQEAPEDAEYPASVFATFSLAIAKAAEACPEAEKLMEIAAFLAPERIPLDIITEDVMSKKRREKAVAALFRVSLITNEILETGERAFTVHRLVQEVMRGPLTERRREIQQIALRLMRDALKEVEVDEHVHWPRIATLVPHAVAVLGTADESDKSEEVGSLCDLLGSYFHARGDYPTAQPYLERALAIAEAALGADHPGTLTQLTNLAFLHESRGGYGEAEPRFVRALAIAETALGCDHPRTGDQLNALALLFMTHERYAEAEPLLIRSLAIAEATLSPDHVDTAGRLNNLAHLYLNQSRYAEAEQLLIRALPITEAAYGIEHPQTGILLSNLGGVYNQLASYQKAEQFFTRALEIARRLWVKTIRTPGRTSRTLPTCTIVRTAMRTPKGSIFKPSQSLSNGSAPFILTSRNAKPSASACGVI